MEKTNDNSTKIDNLFDGCKVTVRPNGKSEIWIQDKRGHGFRITAGAGPAGLRVTAARFAGGNAITMTGNAHGTEKPVGGLDMSEVSICQYNNDEWSQAFKLWYFDPEQNPYPGEKSSV